LHLANIIQLAYGGMIMRRLLMVVCFLVIFMLANTSIATAQFTEARVQKLRVAVDAPDFTLKELGGGKISLKELRRKIILLNFFATFCPNCKKETPTFVKLHEEFKNTDLVILKLASKEKEQDLKKYKNEFNISSPILFEDDAAVSNAYGVWSRPQTFFINREGKIIARVLKEMDWTAKNMKDLIEYLLKEKK
jgi:peroxiredoxin